VLHFHGTDPLLRDDIKGQIRAQNYVDVRVHTTSSVNMNKHFA